VSVVTLDLAADPSEQVEAAERVEAFAHVVEHDADQILGGAALLLRLRALRLGETALAFGDVARVDHARHRDRRDGRERDDRRRADADRRSVAARPPPHQLPRRVAVGVDELAGLEPA
jgi:hypothetical protein